jgi:hypothetical protein
MTGKAYYITTLADWQRHAARFANSHWLALDPRATNKDGFVGARHAVPGAALPECSNEQYLPGFVTTASPPAILAAPTEIQNRPQDAGATNALGPGSEADLAQQRQASLPGPPQADHAPTENPATPGSDAAPANGATKILVLIEADEGVHLSLEDDLAFEALPHPLAQKPISDAAQSALAPHGVPPGATTFDAAEAVARIHPLLRHRVF